MGPPAQIAPERKGRQPAFARRLGVRTGTCASATNGHQVSLTVQIYLPGGACFSSRGKAGSKQAQLGALEVQMVTCGFPISGSSSVPARTPIMCSRASTLSKHWRPACGAELRCMRLPLAARFGIVAKRAFDLHGLAREEHVDRALNPHRYTGSRDTSSGAPRKPSLPRSCSAQLRIGSRL